MAAVFFKPQKGLGGRFESTSYKYGEFGRPIIDEAIGGIETKIVGSVDHGDHTVFVAEVKTAVLNEDVKALNLENTGWTYGG